MGIHFILTGCPIPLFHIEQIDKPLHVEGVRKNQFLCSNGNPVSLPHVFYIPTNRVFQIAVQDGIEISPDGSVYGRIKLWYHLEPTPWWYDVRKINLSALALLIDPNCSTLLKEQLVSSEYIEYVDQKSITANHYSTHGWPFQNYYIALSIEKKMNSIVNKAHDFVKGKNGSLDVHN